MDVTPEALEQVGRDLAVVGLGVPEEDVLVASKIALCRVAPAAAVSVIRVVPRRSGTHAAGGFPASGFAPSVATPLPAGEIQICPSGAGTFTPFRCAAISALTSSGVPQSPLFSLVRASNQTGSLASPSGSSGSTSGAPAGVSAGARTSTAVWSTKKDVRIRPCA
jgi:hypothetical protein